MRKNAEALYYEPRDDLLADLNVIIITAVFDLGQLCPIRERLGELIEERVRYFKSYAIGIYQNQRNDQEYAMGESLLLDNDGDVMMG